MFDNGQPQTGAAHTSAARFIDAVKALKKTRQMPFGNANPFIPEVDANLLVRSLGRHHNAAGFRAVLDCIVQQIHRRLLHQIGIHAGGQPLIAVQHNFDLLGIGIGAAQLDRIAQHTVHRAALQPKVGTAMVLFQP